MITKDGIGREPPESDLEKYIAVMTRVKLRIDEAKTLLWTAKDERSGLYAAVQLRLAIEEVAVASFVGNRRVLENLNYSLRKVSWKSARKLLLELNARYWPNGITQVRHPDGQIEWTDADGRIEEEEVAEIWGRLSSLLHAANPYDEPINWPDTIACLREVTSRLILTLSEHILHLYGSTHLVCGQFWSDPPNFYIFENVGDAKDLDESDLRNQHLVTAQAPQSGSP